MYIRKEIIIKKDNETWYEYAHSLVQRYPKGYMNYIQKQIPELLEKFIDLPYKKLGERFYNWLYPNSFKTCKKCNTCTKFKQFSHGYYEYCSYSCRAKDKESNLNGLTQQAVDKRKQWRKNLTKIEKNKIYQKVKKTRIDLYGVDSLKNLNKLSQKTFAELRPQQLNDKSWLHEQYVVNKKSKVQIAKELQTTFDVVSNACNRFNFPKLNNKSKTSSEENEISSFLKQLSINIDIGRRDIIHPYELDIFVPDHNIAIEYCGLYWHSTANKRITSGYHNKKRLLCNNKGIKLITIFEDEWIIKKDIVKSRLLHLFNKNYKKIYARKCNIVSVDNIAERNFLNKTHIQGYKTSLYNYGLEYNNNIVAIMSFGKSRYDKKIDYEMLRYSTDLNVSVVGGASRLLKHFVKTINPKTIVSYSDNRWGAGGVYATLNFTFVQETRVSYWYFKPGKYQRIHRSAFMKHKIVKNGGDPLLTETENMKKLGYLKIYDCGTKKWILNL